MDTKLLTLVQTFREMKKHRKRWSTSEKMEILNHYKLWGPLKTSREFGVSMRTIYTWKEKYKEGGEESEFIKEKEAQAVKALEEVRRLQRENEQLKKIVAEKELHIRIQEELLKKSD